MSDDARRPPRTPPPRAPRLVGHAGLWACLAALAGCVALGVAGASRGGAGGGQLLAGLLLAPVAALGAWLFGGFLGLGDWAAAPDVPLGLKLVGHLGRVMGSLAAAGCGALTVLAALWPQVPRPGLAGLFFLGFFVGLLVRVLACGLAELQPWARAASQAAAGLALALLAVALVLNGVVWRAAGAWVPLGVLAAAALGLFLGLVAYLNLPRVAQAFAAPMPPGDDEGGAR
ncbi:MAG: hypothetical protein ACLF0G_12085 [Candidatus Brocadiia bacterium]